jgi:uncharacterized membrane protein
VGFLNKILSLFDKKGFSEEDLSQKAKASPFIISTSFRPIRLNAKKDNSCDLIVKLTNKSNSKQLCSIIVQVPNELGLDNMRISKSKEYRLGELEPNETKTFNIPIYAGFNTPQATYRLVIKVNAHYRSYQYIQNSVQKYLELRAV